MATLESFADPAGARGTGRFLTLTTRIYADLALAGDPDSFVDAVTLAPALVLVAAVVVAPADLVLGPKLRAARTAGSRRRPDGGATARPGRGGGAGVSGYTVLAVGLPTVALVAASVTRAVGVPPTPSNWTRRTSGQALTAADRRRDRQQRLARRRCRVRC